MKKRILCAVLIFMLSAAGTACVGKHTQPDDTRQEEQHTQQPDIQQEMQDTQSPDTQQDQHAQDGQGGEEGEQGEPYQAQLPTGKEDADIFVEPIEDISEDFIRGMDVSSVIAQEESGVVYYNEQGEQEDLFRILADAGVNYIRARVWNDPYDKEGNGYGGGNSDVAKAAKIGARAAQNGMKLLVDFHYSDLWADPEKQFAPKAWAHMNVEEKQQALYEFTKESLQTIIDAGGQVGMVQIGNEINYGMAGEKEWEHIVPLLEQGSRAVREIAGEKELDIKIAVHFADIDDHDQTVFYAKTLADAGLDYDIFGVSYYPYWHGRMKHMATVLKDIRNSYGKETAVLETAYCYTLEDGDGFANSIGKEALVDGYTASVQSQASCVRDVMAAAASAEALGVFYWEGAWIPVGAPDQMENNQKLWEKYGSGWASSYAGTYDKQDAGKNYGGCAWDNQAMFDASGHPLASLNVFKYLEYGTSCEQAVDYVKEIQKEVYLGDALYMPETVEVVYNDRSMDGPAAVVWDQAQLDRIKTDQAGEYTVTGKLEDGTPAVCQVTVANKNWLLNPGFEKNDISMWKVTYKGDANPTDIQEKEADAKSGVNSFHFWSEEKQNFQIEQKVSGLEKGTYELSVNIQGGDVGDAAKIYLYAIVNGKTLRSKPVELKGWNQWKKLKIKKLKMTEDAEAAIGVKVKCAGGGWGTMDDFALIKYR